MAQLTCENVSLGYDNKTILSNLSFSVNSGDSFYQDVRQERDSDHSIIIRKKKWQQMP